MTEDTEDLWDITMWDEDELECEISVLHTLLEMQMIEHGDTDPEQECLLDAMVEELEKKRRK